MLPPHKAQRLRQSVRVVKRASKADSAHALVGRGALARRRSQVKQPRLRWVVVHPLLLHFWRWSRPALRGAVVVAVVVVNQFTGRGRQQAAACIA